jgi:translation initiation factor 3 subunit I
MVKYNREGDILFTTGKDGLASAWWSSNGERIGTYRGHNGAVWACDVNFTTTILATGSADNTARLWNAETGVVLLTLAHKAPVHFVNFSLGDKMLLTVTDPFMQQEPSISVFPINGTTVDSVGSSATSPKLVIEIEGGHKSKCTRALWANLNKSIFSCHADGRIIEWDAETGDKKQEVAAHSAGINDMQMSLDGVFLITASSDNSSKLWDLKTMTHLKTYQTERPVNSAAISPVMEHIALGGGQEASQVTTTSSKSGKFEVRFFHQVYEYEMGSVGGHFGPVNSVAFNPDGRSYTSGAEEGYVRICHFDPDYFVLEEE